MSSTFRHTYAALTDFIDTHPEIEIRESVIGTPKEVRPEFNALFNPAGNAFIAEFFPECLSRARRLKLELSGRRKKRRNGFCSKKGPGHSV